MFPLEIHHGHFSNVQPAPYFHPPLHSLCLSQGKVGMGGRRALFLSRALEGTNLFSLFPSLIFSLPFSVPACSWFTRSRDTVPFFPQGSSLPSLSGELLSFLFCLFFCLECLSLHVSVAERTHSQWIQCKFHLPLGKYTTLSKKVFAVFLFIWCSCFVFYFYFTIFPFIWRE